MRIRLIAVGTRLPNWVQEAYAEYTKRLGRWIALELIEIPAARRTRTTQAARAVAAEGERMLGAIREREQLVALEVDGRALSTEALAEQLAQWTASGRDIALLVGGPDGLDPRCRARASASWSLSPLTLPHSLVRVVVAEQLYRAASLLNGHPYHRG